MRTAAAFTLVEALLAISMATLAGSVLLLGITSSLQTTREALEQTIAEGMARQLMDEVIGARYAELGLSPYNPILLADGQEVATGTRGLFDDIDDYNGYSAQPPTDRWGIELGKDDGEGGERHPSFQAPAGCFDNWRQEIDVHYVDPSNPTTPLAAGQVSDYRAVTVRIVYVDPDGGERVLSKLRRVVAYVPPL